MRPNHAQIPPSHPPRSRISSWKQHQLQLHPSWSAQPTQGSASSEWTQAASGRSWTSSAATGDRDMGPPAAFSGASPRAHPPCPRSCCPAGSAAPSSSSWSWSFCARGWRRSGQTSKGRRPPGARRARLTAARCPTGQPGPRRVRAPGAAAQQQRQQWQQQAASSRPLQRCSAAWSGEARKPLPSWLPLHLPQPPRGHAACCASPPPHSPAPAGGSCCCSRPPPNPAACATETSRGRRA
jgi:hypothetical protein